MIFIFFFFFLVNGVNCNLNEVSGFTLAIFSIPFLKIGIGNDSLGRLGGSHLSYISILTSCRNRPRVFPRKA